MSVTKDEHRTAGAILAEMMRHEIAGEDVTELKQEFREQSAKQLGVPNDCFVIEWGNDKK